MKMFRMFNGVDAIPMQWNALGVRVPLSAILILVADLFICIVITEIAMSFVDNAVLVYSVVAVPGVITALAVIIVVVQFSRLGPLPILTQYKILRSTAKKPHWDGLPYTADEED